METSDRKHLTMYVLKQLENGRKKYPNKTNWDKRFIREGVDSFHYEYSKIIQKYINILIFVKTSEYFNNNIHFDTFLNLCEDSVLINSLKNHIYHIELDGCVVDNGSYDFDTTSVGKIEFLELVDDVKLTLLHTIYMYVNKGLKLSEDEIKSYLLFGKNVF